MEDSRTSIHANAYESEAYKYRQQLYGPKTKLFFAARRAIGRSLSPTRVLVDPPQIYFAHCYGPSENVVPV